MTMTSFEDRLLVELRHEVASRQAPTPRRGRWIAAGVGALGAMAAAVVVALGGGSAAYAVEPGSNGTVTVKIHDLSDATGLQRELRAAGVPAVVKYDAAPPACGAGVSPRHLAPGEAGATSTVERGASSGGADDGGPSFSTGGAHRADQEGLTTTTVEKTSDGVTFTISARSLPPGGDVYITTQSGQVDGIGMAICPSGS
jgi:hypothetical protein